MNSTAKHFSPRASLAALGLRLCCLGLFEAIAAQVHIPGFTLFHSATIASATILLLRDAYFIGRGVGSLTFPTKSDFAEKGQDDNPLDGSAFFLRR